MAECIERTALLKKLKGSGAICDFGEHLIEQFPAADVAPVVHACWIEKEAPAARKYFECSNCSAHENKHTAIKGYYCWRCGVMMDGGGDT